MLQGSWSSQMLKGSIWWSGEWGRVFEAVSVSIVPFTLPFQGAFSLPLHLLPRWFEGSVLIWFLFAFGGRVKAASEVRWCLVSRLAGSGYDALWWRTSTAASSLAIRALPPLLALYHNSNNKAPIRQKNKDQQQHTNNNRPRAWGKVNATLLMCAVCDILWILTQITRLKGPEYNNSDGLFPKSMQHTIRTNNNL